MCRKLGDNFELAATSPLFLEEADEDAVNEYACTAPSSMTDDETRLPSEDSDDDLRASLVARRSTVRSTAGREAVECTGGWLEPAHRLSRCPCKCTEPSRKCS